MATTGELAGDRGLYASTLPRAVETARSWLRRSGAARRAALIVVDRGLCELHPGEADGLTWQAFTERFGIPEWDDDPDAAVAPGGESGPASSTGPRRPWPRGERHRGELVVVASTPG